MEELAIVLSRLEQSAAAAQEILNATSGSADHPVHKKATGATDTSPQWVVRCTWEVVRGLPHPEHTYTNRDTESAAVDYAVRMLDNYDSAGSLRLVEVHVKGPGRDDWIKVQ
jgi:hypothetical protein